MALIPHPLLLDFETWANQVRNNAPMYTIPLHQGVDRWRGWANQIINSNQIAAVPIPSEISYPGTDGWKEWATRFYYILQNNT